MVAHSITGWQYISTLNIVLGFLIFFKVSTYEVMKYLQFLVLKMWCQNILSRRSGEILVEANPSRSSSPELEILAEVDEAVLDAASSRSSQWWQWLSAGQRQSSKYQLSQSNISVFQFNCIIMTLSRGILIKNICWVFSGPENCSSEFKLGVSTVAL